MSLKDFETRLQLLCDEIARFIEVSDFVKPGRELLAAFRYSDISGYSFDLYGLSLTASNHAKLASKTFHEKQFAVFKDMVKYLHAAIPAVDHLGNQICLNIYPPATNPKVALEISSMRVGGSKGIQASNVIKKLKVIEKRLEGVLKPVERRFWVGQTSLYANDFESAYRTWAAFQSPSSFTPEGRDIHPPEIVEVINETRVAAAHLSLQNT
jgi:hypothetical protein